MFKGVVFNSEQRSAALIMMPTAIENEAAVWEKPAPRREVGQATTV